MFSNSKLYLFKNIAEAYESMVNSTSYDKDQFIVPDVKWLVRNYIKLNNEMFNGKLPNVGSYVVPTIRVNINEYVEVAIGQVLHPNDIRLINPESLVLGLTNRFEAPQNIYEDALLHEMIHVENLIYFPEQLFKNGRFDKTVEHSTKCFVDEMNRLNEQFNRNVQVFANTSDRNIYRITPEHFNANRTAMNNITFYCIHIDDNKTFVFKTRDDNSHDSELVKKLLDKYQGLDIEKLKPNNWKFIHIGKFIEDINHALVIIGKDEFDIFKKDVTRELDESIDSSADKTADSENEKYKNMPDWVRTEIENGRGENVAFYKGKWYWATND